ncbi:MAG: response regulator, partial [Deltaproteobacteria bacterium]|nr:response regulator [Deltaproteobacteria bacterium]
QNLVCETRDLKAFAAAILDSFSLIARKRKINLAFQPAADLPPVSIDPGKMEKVLFNLIGNAFKFTPDRGAITVSIDADVDHGGDAPASPRGVTLSVQDTGVGIESERLEHIFDRFHQGGGSYGRDYGGAGIGLAYAKELVEMMGGSIGVTSTCGEGSAFSIVLPVDPSALECSDRSVDDLPLQAEIELSDVYQEQEADHESLSGEKPLVLIVDDNPDVRRYVAGALQDGYDFVTAVNGREALVKIEQRVPDLILCDVMMPVMDGYALLKQVKSRPGLQQTPFVFLTARAETDMKVEGLEFGADDYIVKPFNSLELRARVRALLRLRDLLAETETQQQQISRL